MFSPTTRRLAASHTPSMQPFSAVRRSLFKSTRPSISQSLSNARYRPTQIPLSYPSTQIRYASFPQRLRRGYRIASKDLWRRNPIVLPLAMISIIAASAFFTYAIYIQTRQVNPRVTRFPDPVANELRKALYYTEVNLEPHKALDHYKEALKIAAELNMSPFSDEVIGIKLQVAEMLVKAGLHKNAVQVVSRTAKECLQWVNSTRVRLSARNPNFPSDKMPENIDPNTKEIFAPPEEDYNKQLRLTSRIVKKVIGMNLFMAQLWEDSQLKDNVQAFILRRTALDIFKQEISWRERKGLPPVATPEEGDDWMDAEEASHAMSDVGSTWLRAGRPEKALELLLPAVAILREVEGKDISCRQVVLLGNIAAAMFDHRPPKDGADKSISEIPVEKQMKSSKDWALKAIEVSKLVKEDFHDDECDMGCAAAADVLSAIAEWEGADDEARKWLLEEKRYCESAQYAEGVQKVARIMAEGERRRKERRRQT
ncbi:TPR domain protein [Talaromyces proteolyticus]|uniref:TPR domain protein n=1 Tax=Talaromyces proteolyticus TaxID=1131652 RepID=A0AAD4L2M5_9EURO|nr:TPR domain protein [Talaromyces proteolyticus]KAH8702089.1 TPR domain protein [Talaromyces proteolyticus]